MKTTTIIEKEFRHSFPNGSIRAKIRGNNLVEFVCYRQGNLMNSLKEQGLVSFIMENWDEVEETWEAIKAEIAED